MVAGGAKGEPKTTEFILNHFHFHATPSSCSTASSPSINLQPTTTYPLVRRTQLRPDVVERNV